MKEYDLIVIGGGASGLVTAAGAASLGAKVALVEKKRLGGDCLWTGCVPTKSLIRSAKILHEAGKAKDFGLETLGKADFSQARRRMEQAIETLRKHDDPERFQAMGVDVLPGTASFQNSRIVQVDGSLQITGKRIVIATGTRPLIPPILGLEMAGCLTNETILELTEAPKSLLVIGGGPIGLEFAQVFARFGSKVHVVEANESILSKEEPILADHVKSSLERDGVNFYLKAKVTEVRKTEDQREVWLEHHGHKIRVQAHKILVAAGRMPNTESLLLENAGVFAANGFISVNDRLQTNISHIYAAGDVNGRFPFTHAAGYEGKIAVANALLGLGRKASYANLPWVTYTDPELFHLGLTEEEARQQFGRIKVFQKDLEDIDRFVADQETNGMIKVITDNSGKILGAHGVGCGAGDFMQEIVFAKQYGHKIGSLSQTIHSYPTKAAGLQQTADLFWRERLFKGWLPKLIKAYIRWFR